MRLSCTSVHIDTCIWSFPIYLWSWKRIVKQEVIHKNQTSHRCCGLGFSWSWSHGHAWVTWKMFFLKFSRIYWSSAFIKTYISQADLSRPLQNSGAVADFRFVWDLILTSDSPRIDLTLQTGSADSSVPIAINKSWNIQDLAVLFLSVRQHPCLLYILSPSLRVSHCINVYFYSYQVSPLMLTYWHADLHVCRPVIVFVPGVRHILAAFPGSSFVAGRLDIWQFAELAWVLRFHS